MRVLHALEAGKSIGQAVRWLRFVYSKEDGWTRRKVASVLLLSAISARADQTWLGSADNQWTNANNWSGHAVPTAADTVIFNSPTAGSLSSNWLAKPFSIVGLIYSNQLQIPPPITIGGSSLTIGTGGIDISKTFDIGLTNNEPVVLNGSQTWLPGGSRIVMNNVVSGSGNITVQGLQGGSTLLGASNTFAGTVEIANGTTLYCKHPAALGTNGITVAAGTATLYFRSGAETAPIRTPFTIAGPSSPFGGLHVGDGIGVTIESDITCTSNPWINADSNSFYIIKGNIFATNTVTFALLGSATNSISGALNLGSGSLVKHSSGSNSTLRLVNPSNSWSGGTFVNAGTLQIGNGTENGFLPGNVFGGPVAFLVATNTSQTHTGAISASFVKDGLGTLYLTGSNTFGGITNNAGALWLNGSTSFHGSICITNNLLQAGLHLNGTNNNIIFPASVPWYVSQDEGTIFNEAGDNVISGPIYVASTGGDAYVTVNSGTLTLNGQLSSTTTKAMRFGGSGNGTNNGAISGGLQILKQDSGCWTFAGTNSSAGSNAIVGGTLVMNGQLVFPSKLNVLGTGTLSGYGVIKGPTTIMNGGTLALGLNIGTLSISNSLTLNGTNIMKIDKSGGSIVNDLIRGITTLALGGTLNIVANGSGWNAGDSFKLYDAKTYTGAFATFSLPALPGNLTWDVSGLTAGGDGRLRITTPPLPVFNSVSLLSDRNLRVAFSYTGFQSAPYTIWANTNLWPALGMWIPVATGSLSGTAAYDDLSATNFPQRFYRISMP